MPQSSLLFSLILLFQQPWFRQCFPSFKDFLWGIYLSCLSDSICVILFPHKKCVIGS